MVSRNNIYEICKVIVGCRWEIYKKAISAIAKALRLFYHEKFSPKLFSK